MKTIFEIGACGRRVDTIGPCDVPEVKLPESFLRAEPAFLPTCSEIEIDRHYHALSERSFGVCDGFYPLGSCTMKYNPAVNEDMAALPGFARLHPLQDEEETAGAKAVLAELEEILKELTGMAAFTFEPSAGAQGEFTGLLTIKDYHVSRGDAARTKIIVPDAAHGTNPASAAMAGFSVVNIASDENGFVDLEALKAAVGPDTAGLMLTNPNTLGLFDPHIREITSIVHEAGGLCYYDGANLNAVMGLARPADMGFDVVHLNLHKTFSTPHGGGGPGSGPVGCRADLAEHLAKQKVHAFSGNFLVVVKALTYALMLGGEGLTAASKNAVLNANYLREKLRDIFPPLHAARPLHEFVVSLDELKKETGVSALDFAKALQEYDMHPPTMYFPLIVHEALMIEPTETETKETLDAAAEVFRALYSRAKSEADWFHEAPHGKAITRPDEVAAAREPKLSQ